MNKLPDINKDQLLRDIYDGKVSPERLPDDLYEATADYLYGLVEDGYGDAETDDDEAMLDDLQQNIYIFSAAKTFQQISEMLDSMYDDNGTLLTYAAFAVLAGEIFDKYNDPWLDAEGNTSEWAAKSASNWMDFKESTAQNPYLMYVAELDDRTCEICEPLDGILIDMDDSFWDDNATPQHFDCRCILEEVEGIGPDETKNLAFNKRKPMVSTPEQIKKAVEKSHKTKNKMFNYNPGRARVIFPDTGKHKHPYFDVPLKYKHFAENNFGLKIPNYDPKHYYAPSQPEIRNHLEHSN